MYRPHCTILRISNIQFNYLYTETCNCYIIKYRILSWSRELIIKPLNCRLKLDKGTLGILPFRSSPMEDFRSLLSELYFLHQIFCKYKSILCIAHKLLIYLCCYISLLGRHAKTITNIATKKMVCT